VRTPFIVRAPGLRPGRTRHFAEAVDMYAITARRHSSAWLHHIFGFMEPTD
jgi:hypothetical protein